MHCQVDLFPGAGCTAQATNVADVAWLNVSWSTASTASFPSFSNSISAPVSCYIDGMNALYLDMAYLTPDPGGY